MYFANNVREDCDSVAWPNYHFTTSLSHSVGRLYKNYDGLLDSFAAFWGLVAATFTGRDKLLGYELMNEPWCGDIFEDPSLLFPGIADRQYLEPMYDVLAAEIRTPSSCSRPSPGRSPASARPSASRIRPEASSTATDLSFPSTTRCSRR